MKDDSDNPAISFSKPDPTDAESGRPMPGSGKLLRRSEAAKLLGVSKSTLRRMEGEVLTPVVGPKNVRLFHEEEIRSVVVTRRAGVDARRGDGEVAAAAFAAFDGDAHPVDVVKQLQLDPDVVEALHARWAKMRGLLVLAPEARSKVQELLMGWDSGEIRTADDLLAFLRKWVTDESVRTCWQCKQETASFCRKCAKAWGLGAARREIAEARASRL